MRTVIPAFRSLGSVSMGLVSSETQKILKAKNIKLKIQHVSDYFYMMNRIE